MKVLNNKAVSVEIDYFGARYYSSGLSVWLSVDPFSDMYPSMSPYMYVAGNPINMIDPDGRSIAPTNQEARDILDGLLNQYGFHLFNISPNNLKNGVYIVKEKYTLRKFKKELALSGFEMGSEDYNSAIALFKLLKSKKRYEITAISTHSTTTTVKKFKYKSKTLNKIFSAFKNKYKTDENDEVLRTPTNEEINNLLKKGKYNGKRWGFFDDDNNENKSIKTGVIVIYVHTLSDYTYIPGDPVKQKNINLLKTATNEVSKEVKDVK